MTAKSPAERQHAHRDRVAASGLGILRIKAPVVHHAAIRELVRKFLDSMIIK